MNNQKVTSNFHIISNLTKAIDLQSLPNLEELLIIVPCYNEAQNIEHTINELLKHGNFNYLIIDDCSTDDTLKICQDKGWNVIHNDKNLGLSKTFRIGVEYAIRNNYKYVLEFDGDSQYNAADIGKLFFFALKGYDIVTSSRFISNDNENEVTNKKKPLQKVLNTLFFIKTRNHISDPTCSLRMYNWTAMEAYVKHPQLEVEIASIAHMVKKFKMKIIEVPTYVYQRQHHEGEVVMKKSKSRNNRFLLKQFFKMLIS